MDASLIDWWETVLASSPGPTSCIVDELTGTEQLKMAAKIAPVLESGCMQWKDKLNWKAGQEVRVLWKRKYRGSSIFVGKWNWRKGQRVLKRFEQI